MYDAEGEAEAGVGDGGQDRGGYGDADQGVNRAYMWVIRRFGSMGPPPDVCVVILGTLTTAKKSENK